MSDPWLKEGGPAFPSKVEGLRGESAIYYSGMTLRDWYAGMAIASWLPTFAESGTCDAAAVAREAYVLADAMLAERAKEPKP